MWEHFRVEGFYSLYLEQNNWTVSGTDDIDLRLNIYFIRSQRETELGVGCYKGFVKFTFQTNLPWPIVKLKATVSPYTVLRYEFHQNRFFSFRTKSDCIWNLNLLTHAKYYEIKKVICQCWSCHGNQKSLKLPFCDLISTVHVVLYRFANHDLCSP